MSRYGMASAVGVAAGLLLAGSATGAGAHDRVWPGCHCGPFAPTTHTRTIHPARFFTRFHDVSMVRRVHRIHRVIDVTRVQPIIHVHDITRVHHHTVVVTRDAYEHVTRHLQPIRYVQHSVENFYDCSCGR